MSKPIRVLIIEDSEADAQLLLRELRSGGYEPAYRRVASEQDMLAALGAESWHLVICDHSMPQFSAPAALRALKRTGIDLPFIIVSGAIGEDLAVEAMKAGADDFLTKGRLARLVPAVERELFDAEVRRGKRAAEEDLRKLNAELEQRVVERTAELETANHRLAAIQEIIDAALTHLALDDLLNELLIRVRRVLGTDTATILLRTEDGESLVVRASSGLGEGASEDASVPMGMGIEGRIAATGEALIVEDVSKVDVVRPVLQEKLRSLIGAPLRIEGRVIGVLHAGTAEARHFTEDDLRLIGVVADRAASAIERTTAQEERDRLLAELDAIFSSLADPVLVFDAEGRPLRANPATEATYGSDPVSEGLGEFIRKANIHHPDGRPLSPEEMPALRALRERRALGDRLITTNVRGEEVVVQIAASPLVVNGDLKGAVALWHDISERERLLSEVAELAQVAEANAAQLEATLASAAHGLLVHTADGHMSFMNAEAEHILGYSKDLWNSSPEDRVKLMRAETLEGEPLAEDQSPSRRALQGETVHNMAVVVVRGDRKRVWLTVSAAPIRTQAGEVLGAVTTFADATAQHQLEGELRTSEARLRDANGRLVAEGIRSLELAKEAQSRAAELDAIIDSIPDGVVIYDASGEIARMNSTAERMYGYSPSQLKLPMPERLRNLRMETADGKPFPPEQTPVPRALRGETVHGVVAKIHSPGGGTLWTSNSAAPIMAPDGTILGVVATIADITALRELQERQQDLARMISHDLRSPLTAVQGQAQLLLRSLNRGTDVERIRRSASAIYTGARRMDAMIQDLVDVARIESGQLEIRLTAVDLAPYVEDLEHRFAGVLDTSRIRALLPKALPPVIADPNRLERVLINLLGNALKYSEPDTEVVLSAERIGDDVVVSVTDRGTGIAADELPRVFDRYYRAAGANKREGLGLGLYITRMLIEAMGGRIWAESEVEAGSTFRFSLPMPKGGRSE